MNLSDATNRQIEIPYLLKIGNGKTAKIGKYLYDKNMAQIAIFWGEGVEKLLGAQVKAGLQKHSIEVVYQQVATGIDIDDITHTAFALPPVSAVLGIGGGTAIDYAKYAANLLKTPFISIPTAISNDGFSSPFCSLTVLGNRKTVKTGSPFGVVIDLDTIKNSPDFLLYSGIGDMVSKTTAMEDWRTARDKKLARFVDFAGVLAYNSLDIMFLKHSFNIYSEGFQRSLASSLTMSGLAMEMAGSSRPASGSEHLISHALDMISKTPRIHGIQVGVATYLCALLQDNFLADDIKFVLERTGFADYVRNNPLDYTEFAEALKLAPTIKRNFYTVLSEPGNLDRGLEFIKTDIFLQAAIV